MVDLGGPRDTSQGNLVGYLVECQDKVAGKEVHSVGDRIGDNRGRRSGVCRCWD